MASNAKTALLCAYTLAKAKQYAEAEALILSHEELSKTPEAIDLLARIRMEEGDLSEARRLWQGIQVVYPEHRPSRAALKAMGHRQMQVAWTKILACALPFVLAAGVVIGLFCFSVAPRPEPVVVTWDRLPSKVMIDSLAAYQGKVRRVYIASHFFAQPEKLTSRTLLVQVLSQRLAVAESDIFLGAASTDLGASDIRVELDLL